MPQVANAHIWQPDRLARAVRAVNYLFEIGCRIIILQPQVAKFPQDANFETRLLAGVPTRWLGSEGGQKMITSQNTRFPVHLVTSPKSG
jgi:hypothetical protein